MTLQRAYGDQARDLLLCPMAPRPDPKEVKRPPDGGLVRAGAGSTFFAWWSVDKEGPVCASSYGMNYLGLADAFQGTFSYIHDTRDAVLHRVPLWDSGTWGATRASVPIMFDCCCQQTGLSATGRGADPPPFEGAITIGGAGALCINRHDGGVNHLFLDWSVRKVGLKELWTLKWWSEYNTSGPWTKAGGVKREDWPAWMRRFKDY